ncbi:MAG: helix-turn-helix domain-containing protein [Clostridia bacterium]|nr:helix-turn-helix domain-containing protein [Clostridia bacterium]
MIDDLSAIKNYIDLLQKNLSFDIIIYNECGLLQNTTLSAISSVGKWHTNPYCLKIKENDSLRNKCVSLKSCFVKKILSGNGIVKSTCFCGVTEYVLPIMIDGYLVSLVSASGFKGEIKESTFQILSKRVNLDYESFIDMREKELSTVRDEAFVIQAIEILGYLLKRYLLENTDIPQKIVTIHQKNNGHVQKAIEYISSNFTKQIDAEMVANHCHVNISYLQHLFSDILNHGIAEEIRLKRLLYAAELLCTTDYSVKYISHVTGFSSPDYFSTAFKKHFNVTPLLYKKNYKNGSHHISIP